MRKLIIFFAIFCIVISLNAKQPAIKFYFEKGNNLQYNIDDIENLTFTKSNLSFSMFLYIDNSLFVNYDIRKIKSIIFEKSKNIKIVLLSDTVSYKLNDIDSIVFFQNICSEIQIGDQVWQCQNLAVDHYNNGDSIPQVSSFTQWASITTGAWCYGYNDQGNIYGKFYNWYAVNDPRGLAPEGWHVPNNDEWTTLINYLGGEDVAGGKMKSTGNYIDKNGLWRSPNTGATNESGFTALPAGFRMITGSYNGETSSGCWWSFTEKGLNAWSIGIGYNSAKIGKQESNKRYGYSVRCIKGEAFLPKIKKINPNNGFITDTIKIMGTGFRSLQGNSFVSFEGSKAIDYIIWNDSLISLKIPPMAETGKVYVTVYGKRSNEVDFIIIKDVVKIGDQVWMTTNLDVSYYRNGDPIPQITDPSQWENLKTGAWCYYDNDPASGSLFDKCYNWYAVNDPRGLAPEGWHVASDNEWTELVNCLGGENLAGGKMKRTGTLDAGDGLWNSPNLGATNSSGFSAIPRGFRGNEGIFFGLGICAYFWTNTSTNSSTSFARTIFHSGENISIFDFNKSFGLSIRCIKD